MFRRKLVMIVPMVEFRFFISTVGKVVRVV